MLQDYTSVVRLVCHLISLIYDLWGQSGYVSYCKIIPALCIYRGSGNLINPVAAKSFYWGKKTIKFNISTFFLLFATGGWYIQSVQVWILLACWIVLYLIDMFNRMVNVSSTNICEFFCDLGAWTWHVFQTIFWGFGCLHPPKKIWFHIQPK